MENFSQHIESLISLGERHAFFEEKLKKSLSSHLPAKDLIQNLVRTVLEIEFGPDFAKSKGFPKMISTIANAIITNPELRRQSLQVASTFISKKDEKKN